MQHLHVCVAEIEPKLAWQKPLVKEVHFLLQLLPIIDWHITGDALHHQQRLDSVVIQRLSSRRCCSYLVKVECVAEVTDFHVAQTYIRCVHNRTAQTRTGKRSGNPDKAFVILVRWRCINVDMGYISTGKAKVASETGIIRHGFQCCIGWYIRVGYSGPTDEPIDSDITHVANRIKTD